jgi:predicted nucleotidyltransferase
MTYASTLIQYQAATAAICRRYKVRELSVFGSANGPSFRPDSDLDLLVEFQPDAAVGLIQFGNLEHELESLFQRRVDLVPKGGLKRFVREGVLREAVPIYAA